MDETIHEVITLQGLIAPSKLAIFQACAFCPSTSHMYMQTIHKVASNFVQELEVFLTALKSYFTLETKSSFMLVIV